MKRPAAFAVVVIILVIAGVIGGLTGHLFSAGSQPFNALFESIESQLLYTTTDVKLLERLESSQFSPLGWADLLPPEEQRLIEKYQAAPSVSMEDQFFNAIAAYVMDAAVIKRFNGQPDDLRNHPK